MAEPSKVAFSALSDVGMKRSHNQDSYGAALAPSEETFQTKGHLFVVADGMGAHAVGELASKLAVDTIRLLHGKTREADAEATLRRLLTDANETIHERGVQNPDFQGMGTTATALLLLPDGARVGHVGDSRCYRIRGATIEQLSFDHSLQWELARKHKVTPDRITSVPSNIIVRSLGPEAKVKVDVNGPYSIRDGDKFLLCSDGLSGPVSDHELWAVVSALPIDDATRCLVDLANVRGGMDNITAIVVRVGEGAYGAPPSPAPLGQRIWSVVRKVPLTWWFLLTGLSMSGVGYFMASQGMPGVLYLSMLAIILLIAALWGLILRRERQRQLLERPMPPPPPIYRAKTCQFTRELVERFASLVHNLREVALEQHWKVDWETADKTSRDAAAATGADDLAGAFEAYCRSLLILSAGMRASRDRQEVFRPQWETRRSS